MTTGDGIEKAVKDGRVVLGKKISLPSLFEGQGAAEDQPGEQSFVLPYPPTVNHYWIYFIIPARGDRKARVGVAIGEAGKLFRKAVQDECTRRGVWTMKGPVSLTGIIFPPTKGDRNLDNLLKGIQDSMERREDDAFPGAYYNDKQICHIDFRWGHVIKGGKSVVTITQLR